MLADEGFYHGEGFTTTWRSHYPCTSERIHHIAPAFSHSSLIVEDHRDIDAILILHQLLTLLEALVLKVKAVFTEFTVKVLGNGIKASVNTHHACYRGNKIEDAVQRIACNMGSPMPLLQEDAQYSQSDARHTRIDDHLPHIELQASSCCSSCTGNQDSHQLYHLTRYHRIEKAQSGYHLQKGVGNATPCMDRHVHHQLDNQENIDERAKQIIHLLLFLGFLNHALLLPLFV